MIAAEDLEEPLLEQQEANEEETDVENASSEEENVPPSILKASLLLLLVSFSFATLNVCLRSLYTMDNAATPSQVNFVRGWFTVLFFLPMLVVSTKRRQQSPAAAPSPRPLWVAATELALWNVGGQVLVNIGLLTTPSARAAFLGQTVVVWVPLICALLSD